MRYDLELRKQEIKRQIVNYIVSGESISDTITTVLENYEDIDMSEVHDLISSALDYIKENHERRLQYDSAINHQRLEYILRQVLRRIDWDDANPNMVKEIRNIIVEMNKISTYDKERVYARNNDENYENDIFDEHSLNGIIMGAIKNVIQKKDEEVSDDKSIKNIGGGSKHS